MCPIMGEYTKPEADVDIAAHAALTKTHGATTKLADTDNIDTHAALTTGVHGVGTGIVGSKPIDRLVGILATQSGWNTAPTNLAYCTDGDWTTATGIGVNTSVAAWTIGAGIVLFDMGAIHNVTLCGLITVGDNDSDGTEVGLYLEVSPDNSNWAPISGISSGYRVGYPTGSDGNVNIIFFTRGRYIKFRLRNWSGTVKNLDLGITELQAIDLGV